MLSTYPPVSGVNQNSSWILMIVICLLILVCVFLYLRPNPSQPSFTPSSTPSFTPSFTPSSTPPSTPSFTPSFPSPVPWLGYWKISDDNNVYWVNFLQDNTIEFSMVSTNRDIFLRRIHIPYSYNANTNILSVPLAIGQVDKTLSYNKTSDTMYMNPNYGPFYRARQYNNNNSPEGLWESPVNNLKVLINGRNSEITYRNTQTNAFSVVSNPKLNDGWVELIVSGLNDKIKMWYCPMLDILIENVNDGGWIVFARI